MVDFPQYNPPSLANALYMGAHAGYFTARAQREQDLDRRADDALQYVDPATRGDQTALTKLAVNNPQAGNAVWHILQGLSGQKLAAVKQATDFTMRAAGGVLNAPPDQQPAAYSAALNEANRLGYDTSGWPQQWGPAAQGFVNYNYGKARSANEYFTSQGNQPQPVGGASAPPTPAAAAPAVIPQGDMPRAQQMVQYLTGKYGMSPVAAAGVVGGLYQESGFNPNAVGDNGTAGGMGQWRGDRQQALQQFAQTTGGNAGSPQTQLDFLVNDMKGGDMGAQRAYAMLQQAKTPEDATMAMMHYFRPQGYTPANPAAGNGYAQRLGYAQSILGGRPRGPQVATNDAVPANANGQGDSAPLLNGPTPDSSDPRSRGGVMMGVKGVPVLKDGFQLFRMPDGQMEWFKPPASNAKNFEDVYDKSGTLIGQRDKKTNQYHPINQTQSGTADLDPNLSGEDLYAALPPARAAEIRSIVNGDNPIPSPNARNQYAQETRRLVFQAAGPGFTDAIHATRMATKKDMVSSKAGSIGQQLQSQGTLFNHMNHALDVADDLNNSPYPLANKVMNEIGVGAGDPRVTELETTKNKINQELEKYFAGHTTVAGLAEARSQLNAAQSPAQIKAAIRTLTTLVNGQQTELVARINRGLGYKGDQTIKQDDPSIISPEALKARSDVIARTKSNPADNSAIMDAGKKLFGAKGSTPGTPIDSTYLGPDGAPISFAEIEQTAKNRGISTDEVINRLGLKPAKGR